MFQRLLFSLWLMILLSSCSKLPAPVESDIINFQAAMKAVDSLFKGKPEYLKVQNDSIDAALARWDIMQVSLDQIREIAKGGVLYQNQHLRSLVYPRLLELSKESTLDGANAKAMSIVNFPMDSNIDEKQNQLKWASAYIEFAHHPAMDQYLMQEGREGSDIFTRLQFLNIDAIRESGLLHHVIPIMDREMSPDVSYSAVQYFDEASNPESGLSKDSIEMVRMKALLLSQKALDYFSGQTENRSSKVRIEYLTGIIQYMSGAFALGELIDHPAPGLPFYWCSDGKTKSLAELAGKVVVIDFWATWCGPCVGSFENVRRLQERYKDYPVAIVGVTSVQGYHVDRKNNQRIRLPDEPEKEMALMHDFMKDMNMTWMVAFSNDCFDPNFGVRGIPHVAIVDPAGKVRYNMLRPYEPPFHEAEKIDALLKEAGLPYPTQPMEEGNWADE